MPLEKYLSSHTAETNNKEKNLAEHDEEEEIIVKAVYSHWAKKRQDCRHQLLRRLERPPRLDDPSPLVAFRQRDEDAKKWIGRNTLQVYLFLPISYLLPSYH